MTERQEILSVILEEYRSLREEMTNTVDRQYSLTNWTISAVAVVIAALITSWDDLQRSPTAVAVVVLFVVPGLGTVFAVAWSHVITKITRLGWYLHHVEQKVAALFSADEIRTAFHLDHAVAVEPFRYLMGWEHELWSSQSQKLVVRTILGVRGAVAVTYLLTLTVGAAVLGRLRDLAPAAVLVQPIVLLAAALWLLVWVVLVRSVDRQMAVTSHPALGRRMKERVGAMRETDLAG